MAFTENFTRAQRLSSLPASQALALFLSALAAVAALCLLSLPPGESVRIVAGILSIGVLAWAVRQTIIDPLWLILALTLEETLPYLNLIPVDPESRWWLRYPILLSLCLPAIPAVWRSGILKQSGFRGFTVYFAWAAISISYSLAPGVTAGRILPCVLIFAALSLVATRVQDATDVKKTLGRFLIGCGILVALMAVAAVAVPQHIFVEGDDPPIGVYNWIQDPSGILRFTGFFAAPNEIGALMLSMTGAGLAYWRWVSGRRKLLLAVMMGLSVVLGLMANSRSPLVALGCGIGAYAIWKYRLRGVLACLGVLVLASAFYTSMGISSRTYVNRDLSTLTGRTMAWDFEWKKLRERPLIGYGYDVEGAIFQDRYFPGWDSFWNKGSNTSLHSAYVSVAIGLGIPALLFWLFIYLRPWVALFQMKDDCWNLKPMFFFIVLPLLVLSLDESIVTEPRYPRGLLMFLTWMLAVRVRLAAREQSYRNTGVAVVAPQGIYLRRPLAGARAGLIALLVAALLTSTGAGLAADYYVDSTAGNDASAGTMPSAPWRTLSWVNSHPFRPNDVVHLKRGSVFRDTLRPEGPDNANFHGLSFVAYGTGQPPTINGADVVPGWSRASGTGSVYAAPQPRPVYNVFIDGGPGWGLTRACCLPDEHCKASASRPPSRGKSCAIGAMRPGSWLWSEGDGKDSPVLYIWLPGGSNPSTHTVEAVTRQFGVHGFVPTNQIDDLVLDGLRIIQTGLRGISLESDVAAGCCGSRESGSGAGARGLVLRHCVVERTGTGQFDDGSYGNAITIINASAPLVEGNVVSYAGNHGNCINVQNANGARIVNNVVDHWNHNGIDVKGSRDALVQGNVAHDQTAMGAGFYAEYSANVTFRQDRAYNVSNGFQISENASASIVDCVIEEASTCIYFGPRALSLLLRDNKGQSCGALVAGDKLFNVVGRNNAWTGL